MRLSPTTQIERKQLIRGQACYKAQKRTGSALITAIKSEGYKVFRGERTVMRSRCLICNALVLATAITVLDIGRASADHDEAGPWVALFDGKTLGDWKPNENKDAFSVEDGGQTASNRDFAALTCDRAATAFVSARSGDSYRRLVV